MKYNLLWLALPWLALLSSACTHEVVVNTQPSAPTSSLAWTELGPSGGLIVRTVIKTGACPSAQADGQPVSLKPRGSAQSAFPVQVCEATLPMGVQTLTVGSQSLPVLPKKIDRILVIGDTGCRVKKGKDGEYYIQSCNDSSQWPFAAVAKSGAAWKPDLIIHVGDYHYRESPCPAGNEKCKGETPGDRWESWEEDFFRPVSPMLDAAPWIFVRGNHETCDRGGIGWNLLLEPRNYPSKCEDKTAGYEILAGDHRFQVLDAADDANVQPSLNSVPASDHHFLWLLLHRPIMLSRLDEEAKHAVQLPAALAKPGQVGLVVVGHIHTSAVNIFNDQRPPEIISGNSGTSLDNEVEFKQSAEMKSVRYKDFGFMTLERKGSDRWQATVRSRDGRPMHVCEMRESKNARTQMKCTDIQI